MGHFPLPSFFSFSVYVYLFFLIPISLNGVEKEPSFLYPWKNGNELALDGKYLSAIKLFDEALAKDKNFSSYWGLMVAADKAICLEKLEKFEEALSIYDPIVRRVYWHPLEAGHFFALQGAVRCKIALGKDCSKEQKILSRWLGLCPISYLLGDIWVIVPYSEGVFRSKYEILDVFCETFDISVQDAEELYISACAVEDSGLVLLSIEEAKDVLCTQYHSNYKSVTIETVKSAARKHALSNFPDLFTPDTRVNAPENIICMTSETTPSWAKSWLGLYKKTKKFLTPIGENSQLFDVISDISPLTQFKELRSRAFLECGIKAQREANMFKARQFFLSALRGDSVFPTRTSLSATSRLFFVAMQQGDISLMLRLMLHMRGVYPSIPRILYGTGTHLIINCPFPHKIEEFRDWIIEKSFHITGWKEVPKGVSMSISGGTLFWLNFENTIISNAPHLAHFVTMLKKKNNYGIFNESFSGWLISALVQRDLYDDI